MPSRRGVLAGLGAIGAGLYAGANAVRLGPIAVEPVPRDTWPLQRHDQRNTAQSDVTVPSDPEAAWTVGSVGGQFPSGLVVGPDRVYAGGDRLLAIDRADGTEVWRDDGPAGILARAHDRLYAATRISANGRARALRALDQDGRVQWRLETDPIDSLVPTADAIFAGGHDAVESVSLDGERRFRTGVPGAGDVRLMVYDRRLYAAGPMGVSRFRRRTAYQALDGLPPAPAWIRGRGGFAGFPTIDQGRLLVGYDQDGADGAVRALDPATGDDVWNALAGPRSEGRFHQRARSPAVVRGTAVTTLDRWTETGREHAVVGLDAQSGRERWRHTMPLWTVDVAAGRETALVAMSRDDEHDPPAGYAEAPIGSVWALTPAGEFRWKRTFEVGVRALAPVDGTVFALLEDGRVAALRDRD